MRKRKQKKTGSKQETGHGNSRSVVEAQDVRKRVGGQSVYERERLLRMEANRLRMEALGLPKMAASLALNRRDGSGEKGEMNLKDRNEDDDEDYNPNLDGGDEGADELSSSSEGFEDEDDDEDYVSKARCSAKNKKSGAKKRVPVQKQKLVDNLDFMDEDEALKKAIACSPKDYGEDCEPLNGSHGKVHSPQLIGKKKKGRKLTANRVRMNEDDVVIHFCQLDEVGKGSITVRDLERMASSHDFTWTDKELMDMIRCFDRDGDGKLSIEDFRHIVVKCNMLQTSKDA